MADDKRLDEWVEIERFDFEKEKTQCDNKIDLDNSMERKLTRNQKRKNEITSNVRSTVGFNRLHSSLSPAFLRIAVHRL
jgi:hypothetical protein